MPMQNESIDQFVERVTAYTERATNGPWHSREVKGFSCGRVVSLDGLEIEGPYGIAGAKVTLAFMPTHCGHDRPLQQNIELMTNARQDLPAALVHIAALQARVKELQEALEEIIDYKLSIDACSGQSCDYLQDIARDAIANGGKG